MSLDFPNPGFSVGGRRKLVKKAQRVARGARAKGERRC